VSALAHAIAERYVVDRPAAAEQRLVEGVRRHLPDVLTVTHTPGLNVAIAVGGRVVWEAGAGFSDVERERPMTPATVTRAASIAKLYTAICVLQLVEEGRLVLHEPVRRYLPELPIENPLGEREVTVYDLLTSTSGLATDTGELSLAAPRDLAETVAAAYESPVVREYGGMVPRWTARVGERHQYSNLGFATLGHLVERIADPSVPFSRHVEERVFSPLGMRSSALAARHAAPEVAPDVVDALSTGYAGYGQRRLRTPFLHAAAYPAVGLLTTPGDHLRLLLALSAGGEHEGQRVLEPETVRLMQSPRVSFGGSPDTYQGLGIVVGRPDEEDAHFGHGGAFFWGWWNYGRVYPRLGLAIVACSNRFDMLQWRNPYRLTAPSYVLDAAVDRWTRLRRGEAPATAPRSLAWRASYLGGVLMAERVGAFLAVSGAGPASLADATGGDAGWDPDGFRAGLEDMIAVGPDGANVAGFLESGDARIAPEEVPLLSDALGGDGHVAMPLSLWTDG
jgi:CubicO group peptidase (beta-lactamase class C family)